MMCVSNNPNPAKTIHWNNVVLMLGQRRRRWANVKTTLVERLVLVATFNILDTFLQHLFTQY